MTYTKITRAHAKKAFENGEIIALGGSKMRPEWSVSICRALGRTFDALVNEFSYYNCDTERGRRVVYYAMST